MMEEVEDPSRQKIELLEVLEVQELRGTEKVFLVKIKFTSKYRI